MYEQKLTIFTAVQTYVQTLMSSPSFDASHDWSHIQRVLSRSLSVLSVESARPNAPHYNKAIIILAALMHDVVDHKYIDPNSTEDLENKVARVLQSYGVDKPLAEAVQVVCKHVSYSHEMKNKDAVKAVLEQYPELAIVQDADRLDAIGAVGIARVFAYTGAASARNTGANGKNARTIEGTFDHFDEKLERICEHMKTMEGRRLAELSTQRLRTFRAWFGEETGTNEAIISDETVATTVVGSDGKATF